MDDIYAITDLEGYANEMRDAAAKSLADPFDDDINTYISIGQMINLIKEHCVSIDDKNRPLLNEDTNEQIYESTVVWIHNIGLARLASQGFIECAWDEKDNEMIFWTNNEIGTSQNPKKRKSNDKPRNKKKNN